jgi:hypothetical protein
VFEIRKGEIIVIKQYGQQNSASGEILNAVIQDVITEFPAETYGLVLWSHGTGWLPEGVFDALQQSVVSRSFGKDGNSEMSIIETPQIYYWRRYCAIMALSGVEIRHVLSLRRPLRRLCNLRGDLACNVPARFAMTSGLYI